MTTIELIILCICFALFGGMIVLAAKIGEILMIVKAIYNEQQRHYSQDKGRD